MEIFMIKSVWINHCQINFNKSKWKSIYSKICTHCWNANKSWRDCFFTRPVYSGLSNASHGVYVSTEIRNTPNENNDEKEEKLQRRLWRRRMRCLRDTRAIVNGVNKMTYLDASLTWLRMPLQVRADVRTPEI